MADTVVVIFIVAAAVAFIVHRYFFRKSGGCSCGTCNCHRGGKPSGSCCSK